MQGEGLVSGWCVVHPNLQNAEDVAGLQAALLEQLGWSLCLRNLKGKGQQTLPMATGQRVQFEKFMPLTTGQR